MRLLRNLTSRGYSSMAESLTRRPRRFAPLASSTSSDAPRLQGIVFDVDGTLCEPQNYMFGQMRAALGIEKPTDILDHVYSLPTADAQAAAMTKITDIERAAMTSQVPQPGLTSLMTYLESRQVRKALCTRNFDRPVEHLLAKFLPDHVFAPIVTRAFRPPKPDPAGILHIAREWGLEGAAGLIMVGDSVDDMTAGRRAGAATVLLVGKDGVNAHLREHEDTDLVVERLDELVEILERGFVSREGGLDKES